MMHRFEAFVSITEAPARPSYRTGTSAAVVQSLPSFIFQFQHPQLSFVSQPAFWIGSASTRLHFPCFQDCIFLAPLLSTPTYLRILFICLILFFRPTSTSFVSVLTLPTPRRYSGTKACTRNCFDRAEVARVMDAAKRVREALPADIQAGLDQGLIAPDVLKDFFDLQSSPVMAFFTERFQGLRERW